MKNLITKISAVLAFFAIALFAFNVYAQETGTREGQKAPQISLPGPNGNNIALSSLEGKVVLIDFWASWCVPCRHENKNLRKVYDKYKDREFTKGSGFTVYGVSLDKSKSKWIEAIDKDKLQWDSHVSDLQGWNSSAARSYNVMAIPMNFLIDENGVIIAKGLNSKALEDYLKGILR